MTFFGVLRNDEVEDKLNQLSKLEKHLNELQERHDTYVHYQECLQSLASEITSCDIV